MCYVVAQLGAAFRYKPSSAREHHLVLRTATHICYSLTFLTIGPPVPAPVDLTWEVATCHYEIVMHIPLNDVLVRGTLCAQDVPIGILTERV